MTKDQMATYRTALKEARESFDQAFKRLREVEREQSRLQEEMGMLRRTITALAAMCSEDSRLDNLGITDACMEVMQNYPFTITTVEVVHSLDAMGFDLKSQRNAAASVHAVLSRLAKSGKITKTGDGKDEVVGWRGPSYEADLEADLTGGEGIPS